MADYDALLNVVEKYAKENRVPIISHEGTQLLSTVVKEYKPRSVLEIGTAIGYSTMIIAMNAPEAKITTIELDEKRAETALCFLGEAKLLDCVDLILGDAGQVLPTLNAKFDMVFIDAAKGQYLNYLLNILDKLNPNAVVIADNVLFRGMVEGDAVPLRRYKTIVKRLREYLQFVRHDERFNTYIHDIGDGMAISIYQGENKN